MKRWPTTAHSPRRWICRRCARPRPAEECPGALPPRVPPTRAVIIAVVTVDPSVTNVPQRSEQEAATGRQQWPGDEDGGQHGGDQEEASGATGPVATTASRTWPTSTTRDTATK